MKFQIRCKACNERRWDKDIDVKSMTDPGPAGASIKQNFQYCNDRSSCKQAAEAWTGYGLGTGEINAS